MSMRKPRVNKSTVHLVGKKVMQTVFATYFVCCAELCLKFLNSVTHPPL